MTQKAMAWKCSGTPMACGPTEDLGYRMNKNILDWVKAQFGKEESFQQQADYYAQRHGDANT